MGGDGVQHRFACVLTCAMLILLIPMIVFAPATVSKAHTHPGASVELAEMYINKRRASNRQAGIFKHYISLALSIQHSLSLITFHAGLL